jgi:hypothetical protein
MLNPLLYTWQHLLVLLLLLLLLKGVGCWRQGVSIQPGLCQAPQPSIQLLWVDLVAGAGEADDVRLVWQGD